jgi:hypothetical protein
LYDRQQKFTGFECATIFVSPHINQFRRSIPPPKNVLQRHYSRYLLMTQHKAKHKTKKPAKKRNRNARPKAAKSRAVITAAPAKKRKVPAKFCKGWLETLDGRLGFAQALKSRFAVICTDLGGEDRLSYMQRSLIERSLFLEFWISQHEAALAAGREFNAGSWTQAINALQGLYARLGILRRAREVPALADYLKKGASP